MSGRLNWVTPGCMCPTCAPFGRSLEGAHGRQVLLDRLMRALGDADPAASTRTRAEAVLAVLVYAPPDAPASF